MLTERRNQIHLGMSHGELHSVESYHSSSAAGVLVGFRNWIVIDNKFAMENNQIMSC